MGPHHTFADCFFLEESGLFYPLTWDSFWCDIWENYQCLGGAEERLARSSAIGWSVPQPTFSGGRYKWPWAAIGHGETSHHHQSLHPSLIPVLSCCQSARWVRHSILLLLYCSVCVSWSITQMEFLVVSKSGQIAFVDPADHHHNAHVPRWWVWFLPFLGSTRLMFEGEFWRRFSRFTGVIRLSEIHGAEARTFIYARPAVVCRQNRAALSFPFFTK